MNLKLFLSVLVLASVFCTTTTALAMTESERQAAIVQIQTQITQLTQQLTQMLADQQGTSQWCYTFNTNLGYAQSGTADIANLHLALQQEGISYTPDSINTYSTGTETAVTQFQTKYNISPQSGYVGNLTRVKLNQLYGCTSNSNNANTNNNTNTNTCTNWTYSNWSVCSSSGTQTRTITSSSPSGCTGGNPITSQSCNYVSDCIPQWDCSGFGACNNGTQTQICTDSNGCGTTTDRPALTRSCALSTLEVALELTINGQTGVDRYGLYVVDLPGDLLDGLPFVLAWSASNATSCTFISSTCKYYIPGMTWSGYSERIDFCKNIGISTNNPLESVSPIGSKSITLQPDGQPWQYRGYLDKIYRVSCQGVNGTTSKEITAHFMLSGDLPHIACTKDSDCNISTTVRESNSTCIGSQDGCWTYFTTSRGGCENPGLDISKCVTNSSTESCWGSHADCVARMIHCTPNWQARPWTACFRGEQTRDYFDSNHCSTLYNYVVPPPLESQPCT